MTPQNKPEDKKQHNRSPEAQPGHEPNEKRPNEKRPNQEQGRHEPAGKTGMPPKADKR